MVLVFPDRRRLRVAPSRAGPAAYLFAAGWLAVAAALQFAFNRSFGPSRHFPVLLSAVALAAALWGLGPALLALVLGLAASLLLQGPAGPDLAPLALDTAVALLAAVLVARVHAERDRAETTRRNATALLEQMEREFRDSPLGRAHADPATGRLARVNPRLCALLRVPEDALQSRTLVELAHPEDRAGLLQGLTLLREGAISEHAARVRFPREGGEEAHAELRATLLRDEAGTPWRLSLTLMDVTGQQRLEERLVRSEERSRLALRATRDAVWDWDLATGRIAWNDAIRAAYGWPEALGGTDRSWWEERVHPEDRDRVTASLAAALESGREYWTEEYRLARADGTWAHVVDRAYVLLDRTRHPVRVVGALLDVSGPKAAERDLREGRRRFRDIAEALPQIVWTAQPDGSVDFVNRRWREYIGPEGDWRGEGTVHPDDAPATREQWAHALATGEPFRIEHRLRSSHGEYRWFLTWAVPLRDAEGRTLRWYGSATEIEEQKRTEALLRRREAEMVHLSRELEARTRDLERRNRDLARFASFVSHDLQEPLRTAAGHTELLEKALIRNEDPSTPLLYVKEGLARMQRLVRGLLEITRVETRGRDLQPTAPRRALDQALANLSLKVEESGARITVDPLPDVRADPDQLAQVWQNLLDNTLKYAGSGSPVVHVSASRHGDVVTLSVADRGPGIPPEDRDRIFDAFTRLRSAGHPKGSGLGLALVKRIVERHGGRIWVEPAPEGGSVFQFTLPAAR